jgi:acetyl-CoA carboxylase beta subunit
MEGIETAILALDFGFLGGSMGLVVGEKVALALELAARKRHPCVAVITSGGARIQEGVLSLMQMAKTAIAVNLLHSRGLPLISVLGNPATGQVLASFGSLADFIFAEPGAQMGFAPMRAVQEVAERKLAAEYTAEHYLKHGMIDAVCGAIQRAVAFEARLESFTVSSVTGGIDALGDVTIVLATGTDAPGDPVRRTTGHGVSTDVVEASARAYLSAVNRLMRLRTKGRVTV